MRIDNLKEEAKNIRACNGRGYSTVEFIQALLLTEPKPPKKSKSYTINDLLHPNTEVPAWWMDMGFLISREPGHISTGEIYFWDEEAGEFYGNIIHHIPLDQVYGWVYIGELEDALFKKMDGDVIKEVHGFKVGDKVRLADGDGRTHIIKRFVEETGLHSLNFYRVDFEDDTASDHIFPGQPYRTSMIKIEGLKDE